MQSSPPQAHKGSRRATRQRRGLDPRSLGMVAGAVVAGVAWAALVYAGIRFGQSARGGNDTAWIFMLIAALGAVACLFLALMLGTLALRSSGIAPRGPVRSVVAKGGKRSAGKRAGTRR